MRSSTKSYRESLKATGIVGGAQVVQILIKIINTKFIAILLGPSGMGIIGLLQSTLSIVNSISGMGLGGAAVRDVAVAVAVSKEDQSSISHTIIALRRLSWITGLAGGLFSLLAASWLSELTFSSKEYTFAFQILGASVVFSQLYKGQMALIQGYRRLKDMAVISILGGLSSLLFAVPLYYFFGENAIVPALLVLAVIPVFLARFFVRRINFEFVKQSFRQTIEYGKPMIKLGFAMMSSGLVLMISIWLVRLEVQNSYGVEGVGQFQAGWGVTTVYLQLIFQAMSRDFYPRLSGLVDQQESMTSLVNEQIHLSLLIGAPLILAAIVFAPYIINILYSNAFTSAIPQMQWLALGTLFKVLSWPLGFILLALKKSKVYFIVESLWGISFWVLSKFALARWGIDGIGIAFSISYLLYLFATFIMAKITINFSYDWQSIRWILLSLIVAGIIFYLVFVNHTSTSFWIAVGMLFVLTFYYGYKLNRLTHVFSTLWSKLK